MNNPNEVTVRSELLDEENKRKALSELRLGR